MKRFVNKHIYTALLAGGLLMAQSCTEADFGINQETDAHGEISLSAVYQCSSRANDYGFADGDKMGIYIADYADDKPGALSNADLRATNVKFTYDESDNKWAGATTIYWKDRTTPVDIYGYYPFVESIQDPTEYIFNVKTRQDMAAISTELGAYEASDLLWAKAEKVAPTDKTINLTYSHAMAGITIRLQEGTGFSDKEFVDAPKIIRIENTVTEATVDLQEQRVSATSAQPDFVYPMEYNDEYRGIVVPQTVKSDKPIIGITLGGKDYKLVRDTDITFACGKMYTFTIKIDNRTDTGDYQLSLVDESITPWIDDPDFHDGIVREYTSINVETPGTLPAVLIANNLDKKSVTNMKVSGCLNTADLYFMGREMTGLNALNLKNIVIDDENEEYDDMIIGFENHPCLHHIVLPSTLKEIGPNAFAWVRLVGTLEIPEGVEIIHENAFRVNHSHEGAEGVESYLSHLILPSTLRIVKEAAFQGYQILDDYNLPDNIEIIEQSAFSTANFTGILTLPSALKELGNCAISGSFDGSLIVPQGVKICGGAFWKCKFTGNLELSEGITEIGSFTFFDCGFKGELKLPSTLKSIDYRAFSRNQFTKIIWGENITRIESLAFAECDRLQGTLTLPPKLIVVEEETFAGCKLITGIELHENVEFIANRAFAECERVNSIVSKAIVPPAITATTFEGITPTNLSLEVPAMSVEDYKNDKRWGEFKRITEYSNFVCRPLQMCALNSEHYQTIVLNSDGPWSVTHIPDWVKISQTSGEFKTQLSVTVLDKPHGTASRNDYIEFKLKEKNVTTRLDITQYDYQYKEDHIVTLQSHTKGSGIKIIMLADGWDAEEIANGEYLQQCTSDMEYFFGLAPYDRMREYFDVYAAISLSQESGINTINTYRDTRFLTIYGGCMQSLIPDEELIYDYLLNEQAGKFSEEDLRRGLVILIPNTIDYIGATYYFDRGTISLCPPSENPYPYDSRGILQHEACGHGFGKLGDENVVYNKFAPAALKSKIDDYHWRQWYMNLSTTGVMSTVPWSHFIFDPRYSDEVDVFEGGGEYSRGIYRSETTSCMNSYIPYFNAISRQYLTKRIYESANEHFDLEDFYANDTKAWGSGGSRYADVYEGQPCGHKPPTLQKGKENQTLLKQIRKQQINNK